MEISFSLTKLLAMGTVAQAYNREYYSESLEFDDFSEPQYTSYQNKDTSTSIFIRYDEGYSQGDDRIKFGTMGAYDNEGNGQLMYRMIVIIHCHRVKVNLIFIIGLMNGDIIMPQLKPPQWEIVV